MMLDTPVSSLKGIGAKRAELFHQVGIETVQDLLYTFPTAYADYSRITAVSEAVHGSQCVMYLTALNPPTTARFSGMTVVSLLCTDGTSKIRLKWFNQPYRARTLYAGMKAFFYGRVDKRRETVLQNPAMSETLPGIIPHYSLPRDLKQNVFRDAVRQAVPACEEIYDPLPGDLLGRYSLLPVCDAVKLSHLPETMEDVLKAKRRISFENALYYLLTVKNRREERLRRHGIAFSVEGTLEKYEKVLPFHLTEGQKKVISEISLDMAKPMPMNRLLQGDVGSGKTAVAIYAMTVAAENGYQSVLMAPTEILAEQHFSHLKEYFPDESVVFLHGGMSKKEKDAALSKIVSGAAAVITGTHALLEESVRFHQLGLIVTDEQHRFGVSQRAVLEAKGIRPDVLVMSATPIPRTLSLLLYGDLDISVIDQLPAGRIPIKTRYIPDSKRDDMYRYLVEQAEQDIRSYVVCPFIEDPEEMEGKSACGVYQQLRKKYPGAQIGLLHGKMKNAEKESVLNDFRSGIIRILVSTTVIEVGVDVPEAAIMVIEDADRFGLAQLHQLRGRVGRGKLASYCFLLSGSNADTAMDRISVITGSNNGFEIAERDLELRGPGDFLGVRQHGSANEVISCDMETLQLASEAADLVMEDTRPAYNELNEYALERTGMLSDGITMN